jgi:hypothetical protein
MAAIEAGNAGIAERQWFIVGRWEEFEGESRANLLRIIGIGAFYIVELLDFHIYKIVERPFHQTVTALAVAWTMVALGTLVCLRRQVFPAALKYVTTGVDVVLLTGILMVADGPRSPLLIGYFLVITLSALRFQLRLIWFATLATTAGYLVLLGYAKWWAGRPESLFHTEPITVPRYHQFIFLLGLALTGIILGQVVRRVKAMASEFSRRMETISEQAM